MIEDAQTVLERQLIMDGMRFLESLSRYYGQEQGLKIWESLGKAVGTDIQGKILFALLAGDKPSTIWIDFTSGCNDAVKAIKAIRMASGCGLKDAKDLYDAARNRVQHLEIDNRSNYRQVIDDLRAAGCVIT